MKYSLVYITTSNMKESQTIGKKLLENRLVSCINIIKSIHSMYWWKEKIQKDTECLLLAKTKTSTVEKVIKMVKEIHSYDCPSIISIPIEKGNEKYLEWINKEVR